MKSLTGLAAGLLCVAGCTSAPDWNGSDWNGEIKLYGTLREVLAQGKDQGRVVIAAATTPNTVGLGALEGLGGEVVVFEGQAFTGRVQDGEVVSASADATDQAAFLALAEVAEWESLQVDRDVRFDRLGDVLRELAASRGFDAHGAYPFVIDGDLLELRTHVIDGSCPIAHPDGPPPARQETARAAGRLVGFYSALPPGTLTHHGSPLHVHALRVGEDLLVAHVDDVIISQGWTLRIPRR